MLAGIRVVKVGGVFSEAIISTKRGSVSLFPSGSWTVKDKDVLPRNVSLEVNIAILF